MEIFSYPVRSAERPGTGRLPVPEKRSHAGAEETGEQRGDVNAAEHAAHQAAEGIVVGALLLGLLLLLRLLSASQQTAEQTAEAGRLCALLLRLGAAQQAGDAALLLCRGLLLGLRAAQKAGEQAAAGGSSLLLGLHRLGDLLAQQAHQQRGRGAEDAARGRGAEPGFLRRGLRRRGGPQALRFLSYQHQSRQ